LEVVREVFTGLTFVFHDLLAIRRFFSRIPPFELSLLKSIELQWIVSGALYNCDWRREGIVKSRVTPKAEIKAMQTSWEQVCQKIAGLENLRELRVVFLDGLWRVPETALFAPLCDIRAPENFVVESPWPRGRGRYRLAPRPANGSSVYLNVLDNDEGQPFRINRPVPGKEFIIISPNERRLCCKRPTGWWLLS
jgi:hypothetical protein